MVTAGAKRPLGTESATLTHSIDCSHLLFCNSKIMKRKDEAENNFQKADFPPVTLLNEYKIMKLTFYLFEYI